MNKSSVTTHLELPVLSKTLPPFLNNRKIIKKAEEFSSTRLRPTEEMIRQLNRIGHEYPFCAYQKAKTNDPL